MSFVPIELRKKFEYFIFKLEFDEGSSPRLSIKWRIKFDERVRGFESSPYLIPRHALFNMGDFNDVFYRRFYLWKTNGRAAKRATWAGYPSCNLNNANAAPRSLKLSVSIGSQES